MKFEIIVKKDGEVIKEFLLNKEEEIFKVSEAVDSDVLEVGYIKHREGDGLLKLVAKAMLRGWAKGNSCDQ